MIDRKHKTPGHRPSSCTVSDRCYSSHLPIPTIPSTVRSGYRLVGVPSPNYLIDRMIDGGAMRKALIGLGLVGVLAGCGTKTVYVQLPSAPEPVTPVTTHPIYHPSWLQPCQLNSAGQPVDVRDPACQTP